MSPEVGAEVGPAVGVIGLGTMGGVIARALGELGPVVVHDVSAEACSRAAEAGLQVAASPADLARRTTRVILSLPNAEVVSAVLDEVLGEWTKSAAGSDRRVIEGLVIDTSTIGPGAARAHAARATGVGAVYLDAPILGRPGSVGSWTIPYGGEPADWLDPMAVEQLLDPLAARVSHVGGPGAGAVLKVVNNQMLAAINAVTAEALLLATAAGLDPGVFVDTVIESGAASVSGLFRDVGPRAVDGDFAPTFSLDLMRKDNALAADLAQECGLDLAVTRAALATHTAAVDAGFGSEDSIAVLKLLESRHDVTARRQ